MKKIFLFISSPLLLVGSLLFLKPDDGNTAAPTVPVSDNITYTAVNYSYGKETSETAGNKSDIIVSYALSLIGSPYVYAGITPDGFDCSGFITHVYDKYGIAVPHGSSLQALEGESIARNEAQKGDLVIFTGTDESVREPGHVGIVISSPGDTISFVHSSSNGGVKISQVEGTGYEARFLQIRRIL
ncbi:C40 family peptidase [Pontibacter vulgaris]|uniref:C40 family peptidase n=1 Tax=Pontibacter vulgaris TaxID=2905679 RepID=UPI001FA7BD31|nr:C40 family peptidase [Pontibacter vulgaris]